MDERQKQIIKECEQFGEKEVRRKLSHGEYTGFQDRLLIEGWLHELDSRTEQELEFRHEAWDEENLSIARKALTASEEANSLAREANDLARFANLTARERAASAFRSARWAMYAAIIAAIMAIITARTDIISLISWLIDRLKPT